MCVVRLSVQRDRWFTVKRLLLPASLNYNKANGVLLRYADVEKKIKLNPRARNYFLLKDDEIIELSDGTKVVVHSQWGVDFDNFLKVAEKLFYVETNGDRYKLDVSNVEGNIKVPFVGEPGFKRDKRIGYVVRLFPSQQVGEIINTKIDGKGVKKLEVRTKDGNIVAVDDMPYLYEVLKKRTYSETEAYKKNQERNEVIINNSIL